MSEAAETPEVARKSDAWTDLGLTLPIFLVYHLGVVFLPVQNAADLLTSELRALASHSLLGYAGLTVAIGGAFVLLLSILGRRRSLDPKRFLFLAIEGCLYAFLMRAAGAWAVGSVRIAGLEPLAGGALARPGLFTGLVMSLGAGFYEEVVFRVGLFGGGAWLIRLVFGKLPAFVMQIAWAFVCAAIFSGWHYVGVLGDPWDLESFVFRMTCGLVLTAIYAFRGFAPAVWTHALYDLWVMVL
jgi:hypothetical protein